MVIKRVEAWVRNATTKHARIVWLDTAAIFERQITSAAIIAFLSSQTILTCFANAVWAYLGPIPLLVSLLENDVSDDLR